MIEHTAYAMRNATGWSAVVTLPRDGKAITRRVCDETGAIRIFGSEVEAKAAAGVALCRILNGEQDNPVQTRVKAFTVRRSGRNARAIAAAERIFKFLPPTPEPAEAAP